MQNSWVPHLAQLPIDAKWPFLMRKVVNSINWTSPVRRKDAVRLVTRLFSQAVSDELIQRNPARSIPATRVVKRDLDPFAREEADAVIAKLYELTSGLQTIYACFLSFLSIQECVQARLWPYVGAKLTPVIELHAFAASGSTGRFRKGLKQKSHAKFY